MPKLITALTACLAMSGHAAVMLTQSSTLWTVIGSDYDFVADHQTGVPAGDIVGVDENPGFFTAFDEESPESLIDGFIAFRVRFDDHDRAASKPSFERQVWVGVDADRSGTIDVFIGVEGSGNANALVIHAAGDTANNSPGSIRIERNPYASYDLDEFTDYVDYRPVDKADYAEWDDSLHRLDLSEGGSDTDYYLSFQLPFADLVEFLSDPVATKGNPITINENTPLQYIVMSSTQGNVLNQDFGGINEADPTYNPDAGWSEQVGNPLSPPMTGGGDLVPEPSTFMLWVLWGIPLLLRRRRG